MLLIRSGLLPGMTSSLRENITAGLVAIDFESAKIIIMVIGDDENMNLCVCVLQMEMCRRVPLPVLSFYIKYKRINITFLICL